MQQNNTSSLRNLLEQLSTEQLDKMLNLELDKEIPDSFTVRLILSVLRERERDYPLVLTPEIENAWNKYQHKHLRNVKQHSKTVFLPKWSLRAASVAVLLLVLAMAVIPQEAKADNLWSWLVRLSSNVIEFISPGEEENRIAEYAFRTDNQGLQQVFDTAVEMGVTEPVIPMWLPDGNELVECKVSTKESKERLYARFSDGSTETVFYMDVFNADVPREYQKDEMPVQQIEIEGNEFYIVHNNNVWIAIWTIDNIECSIAVDCQEDTLYRILKSIYVMEVS